MNSTPQRSDTESIHVTRVFCVSCLLYISLGSVYKYEFYITVNPTPRVNRLRSKSCVRVFRPCAYDEEAHGPQKMGLSLFIFFLQQRGNSRKKKSKYIKKSLLLATWTQTCIGHNHSARQHGSNAARSRNLSAA